MSEDRRMARSKAEPPKTGPSGAARWSGYLDWVRGEIASAVLSLTPERQRSSHTGDPAGHPARHAGRHRWPLLP
jgi:hypothetical protein